MARNSNIVRVHRPTLTVLRAFFARERARKQGTLAEAKTDLTTLVGSSASPRRREIRSVAGYQGTLLQFTDLQIRPPAIQPEVVRVDPSTDILPE